MKSLDTSFIAFIHKLYRMMYYRDEIELQSVDDIIPSSITNLIKQHIVLLHNQICTKTNVIQELLGGLEDVESDLSLQILNELFMYTREMCGGDKEDLIRYFIFYY